MTGITCPHCKMKIEIGVDTPKIEEPIGHLKVVSFLDWEMHTNISKNIEFVGYIFSYTDQQNKQVILEKVC
jgi:hypothetical protein